LNSIDLGDTSPLPFAQALGFKLGNDSSILKLSRPVTSMVSIF